MPSVHAPTGAGTTSDRRCELARVQAAAREGVVVMAGTVARADRGDDPHIRICFDRSHRILDDATARMATAWEAASTSSRPPRFAG
jgi:hypothetical protein